MDWMLFGIKDAKTKMWMKNIGNMAKVGNLLLDFLNIRSGNERLLFHPKMI